MAIFEKILFAPPPPSLATHSPKSIPYSNARHGRYVEIAQLFLREGQQCWMGYIVNIAKLFLVCQIIMGTSFETLKILLFVR